MEALIRANDSICETFLWRHWNFVNQNGYYLYAKIKDLIKYCQNKELIHLCFCARPWNSFLY